MNQMPKNKIIKVLKYIYGHIFKFDMQKVFLSVIPNPLAIKENTNRFNYYL